MIYPVTTCQNPNRITNPYTGQMLIVPCGHCRACQLNRSNYLALWCDLEAQCHEYCVFITLTYANRFIPKAQILDSTERAYGRDLVTDDGEILSQCDMTDEQLDALLKKFHLFGQVPYLRKEDLQKFLKRFRYYAKKVSKSKVRYFACGEYGPVHFRPHYHILLYFSDPALLQACEQIVLASWPFGRVDVQVSRGKCSSYVAGYVNSYVSVPKVFKARAVRPFCVHSQRLGQGVLQGEREKIYGLSAREIVKRSLTVDGKYREFDMWRSFYSYFFPKCKGYADKSAQQRAYSYRIYDYARRVFPDAASTISLAKEIALMYYYFGDNANTFGSSQWSRYCRDLVSYFADSSVLNYDVSSDEFSRYIHRIYTELLVSHHFLDFVCDHKLNSYPTLFEIDRKLRLIDKFYSELDYMHLIDFFETQSLFYESNLYGSDDLMSDGFENSFYPYFYDNVDVPLSDYMTSPAYCLMDAHTSKLFYDRTKHKILNDRNGVFLSDD